MKNLSELLSFAARRPICRIVDRDGNYHTNYLCLTARRLKFETRTTVGDELVLTRANRRWLTASDRQAFSGREALKLDAMSVDIMPDDPAERAK